MNHADLKIGMIVGYSPVLPGWRGKVVRILHPAIIPIEALLYPSPAFDCEVVWDYHPTIQAKECAFNLYQFTL